MHIPVAIPYQRGQNTQKIKLDKALEASFLV